MQSSVEYVHLKKNKRTRQYLHYVKYDRLGELESSTATSVVVVLTLILYTMLT